MNTLARDKQVMNRAKNILRGVKSPKIYDSILDTVGNTPIVRLNNLAPDHVEIYAKLESFNPMGSVKDRLAKGIIEDAERRGTLKPGQTVIEATSGNTGIGLALVCAAKGYPLVVVMAESFSVERRKILRFLGAKVVLTPAAEKGSGMVKKVNELAAKHGWFKCEQFDNPANPLTHFNTTAQEILDCFEGERLDYFVTGFGTGGTLNGVASRLKLDRPDTKIIAAEPDNAPMLSSGHKQDRDGDGKPSNSHPMFRPHLMQGWAPDFIADITQQIVDKNLIDSFELIDGDKAIEMSRDLARKEGIFVGITAGATLAGALQIAETAPAGSRILVMLPDTGERYLSTPLFADVEEEMNADEMAISRSTAGGRFDSGEPQDESIKPIEIKTQTKAVKTGALKVGDDADSFVETILANKDNNVTVFGLAWCEYGWSVKKFLNSIGVDFQDIQIDRPEFNENGMGVKVRTAIENTSGQCTFPQVFVDGKFIGGCTEVFDTFKQGSLQTALDDAGVAFNPNQTEDPYKMLPKWIHSRG